MSSQGSAFNAAKLLAAVLMPKCEGCSLHTVCMPEVTQHPDHAAAFARSLFRPEAGA